MRLISYIYVLRRATLASQKVKNSTPHPTRHHAASHVLRHPTWPPECDTYMESTETLSSGSSTLNPEQEHARQAMKLPKEPGRRLRSKEPGRRQSSVPAVAESHTPEAASLESSLPAASPEKEPAGGFARGSLAGGFARGSLAGGFAREGGTARLRSEERGFPRIERLRAQTATFFLGTDAPPHLYTCASRHHSG